MGTLCCSPPAIEIVATGNVDANLIGTLKLNLPKIFLAARARIGPLAANANALVNIGFSSQPGKLSGKAAVCLVPAVSALGQAVANIKRSARAAASITNQIWGTGLRTASKYIPSGPKVPAVRTMLVGERDEVEIEGLRPMIRRLAQNLSVFVAATCRQAAPMFAKCKRPLG